MLPFGILLLASNVNEKFKEWEAEKAHQRSWQQWNMQWHSHHNTFHFFYEPLKAAVEMIFFPRLALKLKFYDLHVHVQWTMRKPKNWTIFLSDGRNERKDMRCHVFLILLTFFHLSMEKMGVFSLRYRLRYEKFAWSSFLLHSETKSCYISNTT